MSRSQFQIAFDGAPFRDGEIDVQDLAPTLLAFGSLIQSANKALNGDRAEARLKVSATASGSFVALLSVDVGWVTDMLDVISANPSRIVAASQLLDLLIQGGKVVAGAGAGVYGVIATIKFLCGRRPDKVESLGDGTTAITVNGTTIVVQDETVTLMRDLPTRSAIETLGRRAKSVEGLDRLKIGAPKDDEPLEIARSQFDALNVPPDTDEPDTDISRRDAWLTIVTPHFKDGYKWRFSDGGERPFTAELEDIDFRNKVQEGHIALNANDAVRCRLREEQTISSSGLSKQIFVEKVIDHRPGARQLNLL